MFEKLTSTGLEAYKTVARFATTSKLAVCKHKPEIFLAASVVAGGIAVYELCKASRNGLDDILDETTQELENVRIKQIEDINGSRDYSKRQAFKERAIIRARMIKKLWDIYWKGILFGALAITLNLSAHHILRKENIALMGSLAAYDKFVGGYRERVANALGDELEHNLYYDIHDETVEVVEKNADGVETTVKKVEHGIGHAKDPYTFVFDEASSIAFRNDPESDEMMVKIAEEELNKRLEFRRTRTKPGFVFGDELLDYLRIDPDQAGISLLMFRNAVWYLPPKNDEIAGVNDIYHINLGLGDVYDRAKRDMDIDENGYHGLVIMPNFDGLVSDYKDIL